MEYQVGNIKQGYQNWVKVVLVLGLESGEGGQKRG